MVRNMRGWPGLVARLKWNQCVSCHHALLKYILLYHQLKVCSSQSMATCRIVIGAGMCNFRDQKRVKTPDSRSTTSKYAHFISRGAEKTRQVAIQAKWFQPPFFYYWLLYIFRCGLPAIFFILLCHPSTWLFVRGPVTPKTFHIRIGNCLKLSNFSWK